MAIPLDSSQKVRIDTKPNHKEHNSLAKAFNSRILSGFGDCAWRIFYYAFSTLRGIRNPNEGNYPQEDEWFKFYGNIEPKMSSGKFSLPETGVGDPEGINVANPFAAWVFGNGRRVRKPSGEQDDTYSQSHGYWDELARLRGLDMLQPGQMPTEISGDPNLAVVWADSERQRGCAVFFQDQKYATFVPGQASKTGLKELQLLSLGIVAAARKHVRFVMESPILGRYAPSYVPDANGKGGIFRKKNAVLDQIGQAMLYYISYFRGTEDVRARHNLTGNDTTTYGFDFETFFSKQFLLAPSLGLPQFEMDSSGDLKRDSFGNPSIKYDEAGYPQMSAESPVYVWTRKLLETNKENVVITDFKEEHTGSNLKDHPELIFQTYGKVCNGANYEFRTDCSIGLKLGNRFCLCGIFIQSSDICSNHADGSQISLSGLVIDVYLNDKLYETIGILQKDFFEVDYKAGRANSVLFSNDKRLYQFNRIHYFKYPIKGIVKFALRGTGAVSNIPGERLDDQRIGFSLGLNVDAPDFKIIIKLAHLLEMKPRVADAYVMMRIATTEGKGVEAGTMDPVGHFNSNDGKRVFENYARYAVAYSLNHKDLGSNNGYLSANPVYESLRKFIISNIKMADRHALVDYEVDGDGNSVLYFQRFPLGMRKTGIDTFRGLGPSITPVGNRNMVGSATEIFIPLVRGRYYIVLDSPQTSNSHNESITLRGSDSEGVKYVEFRHGRIFMASDYYYISYSSVPTIGVYELDGIVSEASVSSKDPESIIVDEQEQLAPGIITNEWSMFMSYNLYHPASSNAFKPEMYGDIMGALNARCLTKSFALENYAPTSKNVKLHLANVSWRQYDIPLVVTAPSAYNYIEGANSNQQGSAWMRDKNYPAKFAQSCPIYQKPYYIKSVTRVNNLEPINSIIKVVLKY